MWNINDRRSHFNQIVDVHDLYFQGLSLRILVIFNIYIYIYYIYIYIYMSLECCFTKYFDLLVSFMNYGRVRTSVQHGIVNNMWL